MSTTGKIALCGMLSAMSTVLMLLTGLIPIGTFALPALAGLLTSIIVIEGGIKYGFSMFFAVSLLSSFLAPDKEAVLYFVAFFGYYPVLKNIIERINLKAFRIILKLAVFNAAMVACYYVSIYLLTIPKDSFSVGGVNLALAFLAVGNFVFLVYDMCLSMLITSYVLRIRNKFFKTRK